MHIITRSFCLPESLRRVEVGERLSERTRAWFVIHLVDFKMSFYAKDCTAPTVGARESRGLGPSTLMTEQTTTTKQDTDKRVKCLLPSIQRYGLARARGRQERLLYEKETPEDLEVWGTSGSPSRCSTLNSC